MANPIPELKGNIFEDYPQEWLPNLDKVLHYLQAKNKEGDLNLRHFTIRTIENVFPDLNITQREVYFKNIVMAFLKEDFITSISGTTTKMYLTPRGIAFDSFVKARERYVRKYNSNKITDWFASQKDIVSIGYSLFMTIATIISTSVLISKCNSEHKTESMITAKENTIDSLKVVLKYQGIQSNNIKPKDKLSIGDSNILRKSKKEKTTNQ